MDITDLIAPEAVSPSLRVHTKKQLLQDLAARAAQLSGVPERRVFESLLERERLGSTGMGEGIAIPHARISGLPRILGVFVRLESPIPYEGIDDLPVDLVFLLLTPADAGGDHLKALATVSRLLRSQTTCEKLRAANRPEVLYALLTERTNRRQQAA